MSRQTGRESGHRIVSAFGGTLIVIGLMTGCATQGDISVGTARSMQASVVAIAEAASADDTAEALAALNKLEAQLTAGLGNGSIDADRGAAIKATIELVRADLKPAEDETASQPPAEPSPETNAPVDNSDSGGDQNDGSGNDGKDKKENNGKDKKETDKKDQKDTNKKDTKETNGNGSGKKDDSGDTDGSDDADGSGGDTENTPTPAPTPSE